MFINKDNGPARIKPDGGKKSFQPNHTPGKIFTEPKRKK